MVGEVGPRGRGRGRGRGKGSGAGRGRGQRAQWERLEKGQCKDLESEMREGPKEKIKRVGKGKGTSPGIGGEIGEGMKT